MTPEGGPIVRTLSVLLLTVLAFSASAAQDPEEPWKELRFFEGKWEGRGDGKSGVSTAFREYSFIFGGKFLKVEGRSVFEPQEKNPEGEIHEEIGFISFDAFRARYVMREFLVEGFINQYTLDSVSGDGKILVFNTEAIENGPKGLKARITIEITGENTFRERFELASPEKEYTCYITNEFERVVQE